MLEIAEVGAKVSKEEYEESLPPLRVDLLCSPGTIAKP
jgi:hypothetical protein